VVAFHAATLATGRALPLTRTGLSPVGTRQLSWRTEDRLQHQHRCCHADPIPHGRDASGLSLPLAFGMNTRLIGSGRYISCLSASASSASHRSTPYTSMSAKSWPSAPGAPLLERHWA